ncbi:MAG: hypothetical protein A3G18_10310 [Rhodospirillales bacterium RIFCSPLOWO2_12_FULL_58_28]|nr:MAG: hypothetical protein A3H92_08485 [Rhodospirillales bacterium RIFCSPLOWO2_02_FULL_58_16]OHC77671.1 MAG: hypothetical protein A3G18_10310 [Rhodospirillales bacterium RIFCSPLOWO2_12_FULL_58_28]
MSGHLMDEPISCLGQQSISAYIPPVVAFIILVIQLFVNHRYNRLAKEERDAAMRRDYALDSFKRDVVAPAEKGLSLFDEFIKDIQTEILTNADTKASKIPPQLPINHKSMFKDFGPDFQSTFSRAKAACKEADLFLRYQNIASNLQKTLGLLDEEKSLDDLVLQQTTEIATTSSMSNALFAIKSLANHVGEAKARIRAELLITGMIFAKSRQNSK